jgi:hypothetical protein
MGDGVRHRLELLARDALGGEDGGEVLLAGAQDIDREAARLADRRQRA